MDEGLLVHQRGRCRPLGKHILLDAHVQDGVREHQDAGHVQDAARHDGEIGQRTAPAHAQQDGLHESAHNNFRGAPHQVQRPVQVDAPAQEEQQHAGQDHHPQHDEGRYDEIERIAPFLQRQELVDSEGVIGQHKKKIENRDHHYKQGVHRHLIECPCNRFHDSCMHLRLQR